MIGLTNGLDVGPFWVALGRFFAPLDSKVNSPLRGGSS